MTNKRPHARERARQETLKRKKAKPEQPRRSRRLVWLAVGLSCLLLFGFITWVRQPRRTSFPPAPSEEPFRLVLADYLSSFMSL